MQKIASFAFLRPKNLKEQKLTWLPPNCRPQQNFAVLNYKTNVNSVSYLKNANRLCDSEKVRYADDVLTYLEKADSIDPIKLFYEYFDLGNWHKTSRNFDKAISVWLKGLKRIENIKNDKAESLNYLSYLNLARSYFLLNEYENSLKYFKKTLSLAEKKTIQIESTLSELYYETGMVHYLMNSGEEAIEMFQKALKIKKALRDENSITKLQKIIEEANSLRPIGGNLSK